MKTLALALSPIAALYALGWYATWKMRDEVNLLADPFEIVLR